MGAGYGSGNFTVLVRAFDVYRFGYINLLDLSGIIHSVRWRVLDEWKYVLILRIQI